MGRASRVTKELQLHDWKLFCAKNKEGTLCVYRKSHRLESYELDDNTLVYVRPAPHFIFALTENWKANGQPVEWGLDPIMARIYSIDSWSRNIAADLIKQAEKDRASQERHVDNETEAFVKDFRTDFARTFKNVNTANMKKIDKRRLRDGNYK